MFDDFHAPASKDGQKRLGGSMVAAFVLYCGVGGVIIGATATAHRVVEEDLEQVEFAKLPPEPPPPPPPVAESTPSARPKVNRKTITTPKEVPKDAPEESDKPLAPAEPAGPVDGFLDGVAGGTGTARAPREVEPPKKKDEPLLRPVALKGNRRPTYTPRARRLGLEGLVVVIFIVDTKGRVVNPRIVSGPPALGEIVLKTVSSWRYRPATRGGKPVKFRMRVPVRFQES
jgi:protein TonB